MAKKSRTRTRAPATPVIDHSDHTPDELARRGAGGTPPTAAHTPSSPTATKPLTEWDKQARELGPIHMKGILLSRMAVRVEATLKSIAKYVYTVPASRPAGSAESDPFPGVRAALEVAAAKLRAGADLITSVPRDWRPSARGSVAAASAAVKVGVKVEVRENVRKNYEGLLGADELVNLEVVAIANGQVKVKTSKGEQLFFKRGHIVPVTTTAAAAE